MNKIIPYPIAKRIVRLLLSVVILQMILPLISVVSIGIVKEIQKEKILDQKGNEELLSKITLTKDEYKALNFIEKKEFIYHNVLYDLAFIKQEEGHYTLYVIPDNLEYFLQNLNNVFLQKLVHYIKNSFYIFSIIYFEYQVIHKPLDFIYVKMKYNYKNSLLENPFLKIPYPPPKYISLKF
ncbi:MAG: hypothetical protein ACM3PT_04410 [Deltaproteobacteria bacterium]